MALRPGPTGCRRETRHHAPAEIMANAEQIPIRQIRRLDDTKMHEARLARKPGFPVEQADGRLADPGLRHLE
jgi:hypothetical protein